MKYLYARPDYSLLLPVISLRSLPVYAHPELITDYCYCFWFFVGHYVVMCGYDTTTDEFEIRDPACSRYYLHFKFFFFLPFFLGKEDEKLLPYLLLMPLGYLHSCLTFSLSIKHDDRRINLEITRLQQFLEICGVS